MSRRVKALDFDPLTATAGNDESHDFITFLDRLDYRIVPVFVRRGAQGLAVSQPDGRLHTRRETQRFGIQCFLAKEERFHGSGGTTASAGSARIGTFLSIMTLSWSRAFAFRLRLRATRSLESDSGGSPAMGLVSA